MPDVSQAINKLPPFLRELLASPPRAGEGVHAWLFSVARQLHAHLPAVEIVNLLENRVQGCGRHVSRKEIEDAVKNSIPCAWQPKGNAAPVQSAVEMAGSESGATRSHYPRQRRAWRTCGNYPARALRTTRQHTEEIIDRLFPGNPLLCCGKSSRILTPNRAKIGAGELSALAIDCAVANVGSYRPDQRRQESKHTLANTGARRFLICEFDTGTPDEHAALLLHLGTFAPLVCAVHSGGKSLHGWFYVHGQPERKSKSFSATPFRLARIAQRGRARNLCGCRTARATMAHAKLFSF